MVWHAVWTHPGVPSTVSSVVRQPGNALSKARGHATHRPPLAAGPARARRLCSPPAERGLAGWDGAHRCPRATRRAKRHAAAAERLAPQGHRSGERVAPVPSHGPAPLPAARAPRTRPGHPCGPWETRLAPAARPGGRSTDGGAGMGGGKKRRPSCPGTATGGPIPRRARERTSRRCRGTSTTEASLPPVWHMLVAWFHWGSLPRQGSDCGAVAYRQQVVGRLTGPARGLREA